MSKVKATGMILSNKEKIISILKYMKSVEEGETIPINIEKDGKDEYYLLCEEIIKEWDKE